VSTKRRALGQLEVLPIVLPAERGELISSWLTRIARFYGVSIHDLVPGAGEEQTFPDFAAIDVGHSRRAIKPVAQLLNMPVGELAKRTVSLAAPWASNLVTREWYAEPFDLSAPLRPAICPQCLIDQTSMRGYAWIGLDSVIAWRTMCARHAVQMIESDAELVHPVWQEFFRRHRCVQSPSFLTAADRDVVSESKPPARDVGPTDALDFYVLYLQNGMINAAKAINRRKNVAASNDVIMFGDLLWALTRVDRGWNDRLVYEEYVLPQYDDAWHVARRRHSGPAELTRLGVRLRHSIMASAAILVGHPDWCKFFRGCQISQADEIRRLFTILTLEDAHDLQQRSIGWPEQARAAVWGN
jgi:hypothetical protein